MHTLCDVAIVGAGPAGLLAAINLSQAGHKVFLFEKDGFPREKICGDGLTADAIKCIKDLKIFNEINKKGKSIKSVSVFSPSRTEAKFSGNFLTIKRMWLDYFLLEEAKENGTFFIKGDVESIKHLSDGVEIKLSSYPVSFKAKVCILATGAKTELARKFGFFLDIKPSALAIRTYVKSSIFLNRLVISYDESILPGYGWIFPLPDGLFNVGCGVFCGNNREKVNLREKFELFVKNFPLAAALFESKLHEPEKLRGGRILSNLSQYTTCVIGRVLLAGETMGTTLPFMGEGVGKAMESGIAVAEATNLFLKSRKIWDLQSYQKFITQELSPKYTGYRIIEKIVSHRRSTNLLALYAKRNKKMNGAITEILAGEADPRKVFSTWGIIKTLI